MVSQGLHTSLGLRSVDERSGEILREMLAIKYLTKPSARRASSSSGRSSHVLILIDSWTLWT